MSYYRSWRTRGYRYSRYDALKSMFGEAVREIGHAFLQLEPDALDALFTDYGEIHGKAAERYARATFPKWKSFHTQLSGQTLQRLIELVPPYLSPAQRFSLLQKVLQQHRTRREQNININLKQPAVGLAELDRALAQLRHDDVLAHLPESVMCATKWLYDDDITAARAMLAQAERTELAQTRASAMREAELLKQTIASGQVKSAGYRVELPSGSLNVTVAVPAKCFVATACYGEEAWQTQALRSWRDEHLRRHALGRAFVAWYYRHGKRLAASAQRSALLRTAARAAVSSVAWMVR